MELTIKASNELDYYRGGVKVAKFVRYLRSGECGCKFDNKPRWFTDGNKVFVKL
jgi:hypothetical protein